MSCVLIVASESCSLQVDFASCELKFASCTLRVDFASCELKFASCEL